LCCLLYSLKVNFIISHKKAKKAEKGQKRPFLKKWSN
jgi:hypothetical protein